MLKKILFDGLKVCVPILVVLLVFYWVIIGLEELLRKLLLFSLGPSYYIPGLGLVVFLLLVYFTGLLVNTPHVGRYVDNSLGLFARLPGIRTLYRVSKNVTDLAFQSDMQGGKVVIVETPAGNLIGILTCEDMSNYPSGAGDEEEVSVYVPMSYQIGGYTLIIHKNKIKPLNISVQDALVITMSAGISCKKPAVKADEQDKTN